MGSERSRELRRRRHRRKQVGKWLQKAAKGSAAEKAIIVGKLRRLTSGASDIIAANDLEQQ
ncbi:MAG: hypothetical protein KDB22_13740 [Planctomycetales bacterium]|nr:hypothetical protein [Planctomycetales bacterium]